MIWDITFHDDFEAEFKNLSEKVRLEILAQASLLERYGPTLGRPQVDTLNGSRYSNMKELRFKLDGGVWRIAFAFDPQRTGLLLIAGNKAGKNQQLFYKQLIKKADKRYGEHLSSLEV